jgi:hypothetical protein
VIPQTLAPFALVPVLAFVVWRRLRGTFGRQPIRRGRMLARVLFFAVFGALALLANARHPALTEGLIAGVAGGVLLGLAGLRLTRFERRPDGSDGYVPNPWIAAALAVLLLGRIAWRLTVELPQLEPTAATGSMNGLGSSPLTLALFGMLVGYYIAYFSGLLVHHRRFQRAQDALPPQLGP